MNIHQQRFLEALQAALRGQSVSWMEPMSLEDWVTLFDMANRHHVLPMIFEAVYASSSAQAMDPRLMQAIRSDVRHKVMTQIKRSATFQALIQHLDAAGLHPLVVKGAVCRSLYLNPDARMSSDEDVWIQGVPYASYHEALTAFGMQVADPQVDPETAYEVPYGKPGTPLIIELHQHLFATGSDAYGELNCYFTHVEAVKVDVGGHCVFTMNSTDHFFYLVCHAFKHFLHSGFGIRQVCDMMLFANRFGQEIDWERVQKQCREIHAEAFMTALFKIGERYLTLDPKRAGCPESWMQADVDEMLMLEDLLDAGVYGDGTMSRKHSSNITLQAVSAQKQGKTSKRNVRALLRTIFPSAKSLEGRFPYLKKYPYLLPVAWSCRIVQYGREMGKDNGAVDAMKIGTERVELLRHYHVID